MGKLINNQYKNIIPFMTGNMTEDSYSNDIKNLYQNKVSDSFKFASDYYVIGKEDSDGIYQNIGVRVMPSYQIGATSSLKDDYKTILHERYDTLLYLGERYFFEGSYYITIDTGRSKSSTASCQVQRCGDFLRFFDELGVYHSIPAIIGKSGVYDLNSDTVLMIPDNQLKVLVKYDSESDLIKWANSNNPEQKYTRFLLHGQAWRVTSIDKSSFVRNDKGYIDIRLQADLLKPSDNLIANIADDIQGITLDILNGDTTIGSLQTLQINVDVKRNGVAIDNSMVVYSTSSSKCSVSASGLVTGVSAGTSTITATYAGVSDSVIITVGVSTNNYTIEMSSSNNILDYMIIGQTLVFTAKNLLNGLPVVDTGAWNILADDGISSTNLASVVSYTGTDISVRCENNSVNIGSYFKIKYTNSNTNITLRILVKGIY